MESVKVYVDVTAEFSKEGRLMWNQVEVGVTAPEGAQFGVESDGLIQRFIADGVATFN